MKKTLILALIFAPLLGYSQPKAPKNNRGSAYLAGGFNSTKGYSSFIGAIGGYSYAKKSKVGMGGALYFVPKSYVSIHLDMRAHFGNKPWAAPFISLQPGWAGPTVKSQNNISNSGGVNLKGLIGMRIAKKQENLGAYLALGYSYRQFGTTIKLPGSSSIKEKFNENSVFAVLGIAF